MSVMVTQFLIIYVLVCLVIVYIVLLGEQFKFIFDAFEMFVVEYKLTYISGEHPNYVTDAEPFELGNPIANVSNPYHLKCYS